MDAFLGEIRVFGFSYPPPNWAACAGQLLSINQNVALYSIIGTTYGGDGRSNFALPNLGSYAPVHVGGAQPGPGLQTWTLGQKQGAGAVTLQGSQAPAHTHALQAVSGSATVLDPANAALADGVIAGTRTAAPYYATATPDVQMNSQALASVGSGQPHNNMMPSLAMNYYICLNGIFPQRP